MVSLLSGVLYQSPTFLKRVRASTIGSPTPYTVKVKNFGIDNAKGTRSDSNAIFTFAVRSDGSRAIVNTQHHPGGEEVSRIVDFAQGGRVEVGDLWEIKTSWRSETKPNPLTWLRDARKHCTLNLLGDRFAEGETYLG
jgi:hypothetical protein